MWTQIPKMDPVKDPLSKYWDQPSTEGILIDDKYALMSKKTYDELKDCSESQPTGVYPGKMWKGKQYWPVTQPNKQVIWRWTGRYELRWFGFSEKGENFCSNNSREILLID